MRLARLLPRRDGDGLPIASSEERRLALLVTAVATLWFALAASWELFGPLLAGHYASSASVGIIADNMLRWRIAGPVWEYTAAPPEPSQYYCHHPWGIFWTQAGFTALLGRHPSVCRLPAVLLSAATPGLLYLLGRALWRPIAGAVAAAAFVVLPITLAFANFNALEVPVMAYATLGMWGAVRHQQSGRRRFLLISLLGFAMALHADWPAYVLLAVLLGFDLVFGIVLRRPFDRVSHAFAQRWALTATLAMATFLLYVALFHRADKLADLLAAYRFRSHGAELPLSQVLASRRYWLELSFTPIAIGLGALAAIVSASRLVLLRQRGEVLPLAVLVMASVQYVVFKQGADIHVFWPHYFALFFALGMGALTATGLALAELRPRPRAPALGLAAALLPLALIARDGIPALAYARATGGRFNEKGALIHSDGAKTAALGWLADRLRAGAEIALHASMKPTWAQEHTLGGRVVHPNAPMPPYHQADAFVADARFLSDAEQAQLGSLFRVTAIGPVWIVRSPAAPGPLDGYAIDEREPSLLEWYFVSGTEPMRSIRPDPFVTWELRHHFGQDAAIPNEVPSDFEQRRIAHNAALAAGDAAAAARLHAELVQHLDPPRIRFDDGTELLGVRYQPGARPLLTLLFRAAGPARHDIVPAMRSRVLAAPALSTTSPDPTLREVGVPPALAPRRWRAGYLYSWPVAIRKRPGRERFELYWRARTPGAAVPRGPGAARFITVFEAG